jgi:hypothetical protein
MNGLLIYFDGIPQDLDNFNGTESASFVFRRKDEAGDSAFSFAPELTVVGDTYEYVRQQIINAPNPNIAAIEVLIYDTCCLNADGSDRLLFTGKIEGGSVRWCTFPTCEAQVTVVDNSVDAEAIRCLKNHLIWDRVDKADGSGISLGEDTFRIAGNIQYCNDVRPNALQESIMIIGIIFFIRLAPFALIVTILNLATTGSAGNFYAELEQYIVDCRNFHKAPFIDSYMKNLCSICGLGFQSSLFDVGGYYHDTVRLDAGFTEGSDGVGGIITNYETNKPNLNGIQFLDELKQFNIEWRVVNGVLQIERKDYFIGVEWFNTDNLQSDQLLSICYESLAERPAAYAEYLYPKDGVDNSGSETAPKWSQKVIDWNPTDNPQQVGLFSKNFTFASALFLDDANRTTRSPLDKPIYQTFYPTLQQRGLMLMSKGITSFPKLIDCNYTQIVPGYFTVIPKFFNNASNPNLFNYNTIWWVYENPILNLSNQLIDTAYQRLFYIDDPRLTSVKTRKVNISITADCDLLTTLDIDKYVTTSQGQVQITEITYDTNNNSLTIQGLI